MNSPKNEILIETLNRLQVSDPKMKLDVIASSVPDETGNKNVYGTVNETLSKIINESEISDSYHVTGEMNAIADPNHRKVCRQLWRKYDKKFNMVAWVPPENRTTGNSFLERLKYNWHNNGWQNLLDAVYLIGKGEIDLYAQDKMEPIHYSVFGDDLVLLQSKHDHREHKKDVWFIKSEQLNEELKPKAIRSSKKAKKFNSVLCREVTDSITNTTALDILYSLEEKESITKDKFKEKFPNSSYSISNMQTLGLIDDEDEIKITEHGKEYLKLYN